MRIHAIQALSGWKRQVIALFSGAVTASALPPVNFFPVCFLTFPILAWLLDGIYAQRTTKRCQNCKAATLTGWSFGFGYFLAGLWWLGSAMLIDISAYGWAIPFAVLGLPAYLAFFYAFATFMAFLLWQLGYGRIITLSVAFGLAEWLRSWMFTGFPWNAIGYTAMPFLLLIQPAAIIGVSGMNMVAVLLYTTPALFSERKDRKAGFAIAGILIAADVGFGLYRLGTQAPADISVSSTTRVRIIQPSIPQSEKTDNATRLENFERHLQLTAAAPVKGTPLPHLIIWPETSVPYMLNYTPTALARIGSTLKDGQLALVGAVRIEETDNTATTFQYLNSLQVINAKGKIIASADKVHLVPFGEYLPLDSWFRKLGLQAIASVAGGYSAAEKRTVIALENGPVILPLICYEAIFPVEFKHEDPEPDTLVNITNDAWFGNTPGPWQHFAQARIRAVEQGIPLIRAANNGISAVIDPYGRIIAMLKHNETGFIDIDLPVKAVSVWTRSFSDIHVFYIFLLLLFIMSTRIFRRCKRIDNF
ncbi:MAG: apolipoprotein N-acyltransferase [Candidatus Tokpelaia sp. JSC189]|nr:MAG: apolipoprotein N-acyltransferase [Candidatus Tokpelaia sp. JSC189]